MRGGETPSVRSVAYKWISDALEETWRRLEQTLRGRDERTFDALTPCPGWSIRDVVNHLTGVEMMLDGEPIPELTGPLPDFVHNPLGEINEAFVSSRRHLTGEETLDEFRRATRRSLERLRSLSDDEWERVGWSPEGERSMARLQETRVVDSWIHLQDIRDALLEPADDHGRGEEITMNRFEAALPYLWGKRAQAPEGSLLQLNLMGRLARNVLLRVEQGRAIVVEATDQVPTVEITTASALFWRRCAGRISADAFLRASATDVRGDLRLATRFAESMVVIP